MLEPSSASLHASSEPEPSTGFQLSDLLSFEKMIVPMLVRIAYYVGCIVAILAGLIAIYNGATSNYGGGFQVISGLGTLFFGPLLIRIACEQIIVLFGIYDRLGEIRDRGGNE